MKHCHKCGWIFDDKLDYCPECGIENFSTSDIDTIRTGNREKSCGAWILVHGRTKNGKETNPPLYTRICADDIKHKATGKRYVRGRYVLFSENRGDIQPYLIEDTDDFRIIYYKSIFEKIVVKK